MKNEGRLPPWLKRPMPAGETFNHTHHVISTLALETICMSANCPNRGECWNRGTATVLILGNICTRNCKFCSVSSGKPQRVDQTEPKRVADMAKQMNIKYLVITSVDRDDLHDGGAGHFRNVIDHCRQLNTDMKFELLVPDFRDCQDEAIKILTDALPFVFGHNVETVPALYSKVRPGGDYHLSLNLLRKAKDTYPETQTKSSIMLGLGETQDQVTSVLKDLRTAGCDRIAIGQYLKPSKNSVEVAEFIEPEIFDRWAKIAKQIGFTWVMSSPFTRSSFHAEKQ